MNLLHLFGSGNFICPSFVKHIFAEYRIQVYSPPPFIFIFIFKKHLKFVIPLFSGFLCF